MVLNKVVIFETGVKNKFKIIPLDVFNNMLLEGINLVFER